MPKIKAILFDMDGVLCDSEPFICKAAQEMFLQNFDCHTAEEDFLPFVGCGEDRYLGGVAEKHGIAIQFPQDKVKTYDIYLEIIKGKMPALPGVHEFIAAARQAGLKLAVNSAADRRKVEGNLAQIGISADSFDAVVTGSDIEHKIPHPEGYLTAAENIGIAAEECLVVEDAINGIEAGCAAGSVCLGLSTSFPAKDLSHAGAMWTAADLSEVTQELMSLLGMG